jgi:protein-S-isoprenylcysteine O-methyltransferase Ste14
MSGRPWWLGSRGEWYVGLQVALFALILFGPTKLSSWPEWPRPQARAATILGGVLALAGGLLLAAGIQRLGNRLTPLPYPKGDGPLLREGPYRLVRHPIYSGGLFLALGWSLCRHGSLTLGYTLLLLVFLDLKARKEERWLVERFPEYETYRAKVKKLIPFLY